VTIEYQRFGTQWYLHLTYYLAEYEPNGCTTGFMKNSLLADWYF
jgi:hypothetical protein